VLRKGNSLVRKVGIVLIDHLSLALKPITKPLAQIQCALPADCARGLQPTPAAQVPIGRHTRRS